MAISQETTRVLERERRTGPAFFQSLSDESLYKVLERRGKISKEAIWKEQSVVKPKKEISPQDTTNSNDLSFLGSAADWWINENSYDFMKAAYNRSLTGTTEQLIYGKARYDVDDSDFTILEDIAASIVSFFMPLDILTMGVGGKIGGLAVKTGMKKGLFGGALKKASTKAAKAGLSPFEDRAVAKILSNSKLKKAMIGGVQQMPVLGLYEAAMGGVQSKLHGETFWSGAAEGAFHGSVMGFLTGGIGGGMGAKQAEILARGKEPGKFLSKLDKIKAYGLVGMPGQIVAEASVFSAAELGPQILRGEDVRAEDVLKSFGKNVGLFTGLKTIGKVQNKFWKEADKVFKETENEIKDRKKYDEGLDNVNENVKETTGVDTEAVAREKSKISFDDAVDIRDLGRLRKNISKIIEVKNSGDPAKLERSGVEVARINDSLSEIITRLEKAEKTPAREQILKEAKSEKENMEKLFDNWLEGREIKPEEVADITAEKEAPPKAKAPPKPPKVKSIDKMSEPELVEEGKKVLGKSEEQIDKDYRGKVIDIKTDKGTFLKDKLIQDIKAKKEEGIEKEIGEKLKSPEEHYEAKVQDKTLPERESVLDKVSKITEHLDKKGIKESNYKDFERPLKESYYDIQEIGQNMFAQETRLSKSKTKKGEKRLVETTQDIKYIDIYLKFAKELAKDGKSLRDATYSEVVKFISRNEGSQHALKIFYSHLNARGKVRQETLKAGIPELHKVAGVAPRVDKGLRIDRIDTEVGEVRYIQSKTLGAKEISLGDRLKGLFKKILGKTKLTDEAGDTVFRDINNKALTKTQQTNLIKRFFGDVKNQDLRSAFSQYIAKKYGYKSSEWALINELGLGHTKKTIEKAYLKEMTMKEDFKKLQKEFIELIEGKGRLKFEYEGKTLDFETPYPKGGGLNIQQIRDAYRKISLSGKEIKAGHTTVSRDTAEAMIRFMIENAPRPGEAIPQKAADVVFKRHIPTFEKEGINIQRQVDAFKEKVDVSIAEREMVKEHFEKITQYENLEIQLGKDLGKHKGKEVLGQIKGHVIKISKGEIRPDTISHEVSHYAVNVLKKFGDKISKSLIKRGVKMFGSEEKLVQTIGELAQGQIKNKTLLAKAKNWVKAFNAHLKDMFGLASKEDIAFILSRKVVKGNIPHSVKVKNYISKMKTDYQLAAELPNHAGAAYRHIKRFEKEIVSNKAKYNIDQSTINAMRAQFGVHLEGAGKGLSSIGALKSYAEKLFDIKTKAETYSSRLERLRLENNITISESEKIAKALGSTDGNINNLTAKNKLLYEEIVTEYSKKEPVITTPSDHIAGLKGKLSWHQRIARVILPAYEFIGKHGGAPGRAIKDAIVYMESYVRRLNGRGYDGLRLIEESLGKTKFKIFKKSSHLFDTERIENHIKQSKVEGYRGEKLSDKELQFFENTKVEGTPEFQAKKQWEVLRKFYWERLKREARQKNTEAEYEIFEKEFNDKFVNDYFTRRLTKEAYKHLIENGSIDKLVNQKFESKVLNKAGKEAKGNKEKFELLKEKYRKDENLRKQIYDDVYHYLKQDHKQIKNRFLFKRGFILPEFIEVPTMSGQRKLVRTYETSLDGTIGAYIEGMSKHIGVVRHFPDFAGMGGKYKLGKTPRDLVKLAGKDSFLQEYALDTIEAVVGTASRSPLHKDGHSFLATIAHLSAASGLSSPTSGIKNLLIGIPRAIASYGTFNTARGIAKLFSSNTWNEARAKGVLGYGPKTLGLAKAKFGWLSMEKLFRFNLMTQTENVTRIVSLEAGKLYFQTQVNALKGQGMLKGLGVKNANRLMRDMWQLSEKDIKFLEKVDVSKKEHAGRFNEILAHVEQMSHLAAQGSTAPGRLPLWMSSAYGKPLTLFQRIAFSTTHDSVRNYFQPAIKNGNFAPLARALLAHSASGIALYGMYKWLFDTEAPKSSSKGLDKMSMYLWRSEFLGLFGEVISPYDKGMFQSLSQPVVVRNIQEGGKEFYRWWSGKEKSLGKAMDNFAKTTLVAYNQWDRMRSVSKSKDFSNAKRINNWERQFKRDNNIEMSYFDSWGKRSPYYRDLREALYKGSDEDIAKNFYAAYNYIVTELEKQPSRTTYSYKHKEAIRALKSSLRHMAPGNIFSEGKRGTIVSEKQMFMKWVGENFGEKGLYTIRQSKTYYEDTMKRLSKIVTDNWENYSVYAGSKNPGTKVK